MAQAPNIRNLSAEDFAGDDGLSKLIEALNPLVSSVSTGMNKGLSLKDNLNVIEKEFTVTVPPQALITPSYEHSWVAFDTGTNSLPGYCINDDGVVRLQGIYKSGTVAAGAGGSMFTLPVGYRPYGNSWFPVSSNVLYGQLLVQSTGEVIAYAGVNTWFSLDGVTFLAKAPAPPPVFTGPGWPALVDSGQTAPIQDVKVVTIRDVNGTTASSHGGCALQWEPGPGGKVIVRRATRLTPDRTYRIKVLLYPEN